MNVVILGGGASGVFCALSIKKHNPMIDVTILEQNDRLLKKVLKTGNGRCNICNRMISSEYYNDFSLFELNNNVNVVKILEEFGFLLREEDLGRMYPYSESANVVVNYLVSKVKSMNINVLTNYKVVDIKKCNKGFVVNDDLVCDKLVIASGSHAQSQTNAYDLLKKLGHSISKLTPGLVPLITKEETSHMKGIRWKCDARVLNKSNVRKISGEVLFKDHGLSGIMTLDLSNYVDVNDIVSFDLMPGYEESELYELLSKKGNEYFEYSFPKMLYFDIEKRAKRDNIDIIKVIKNYCFTVTGKKGFNDAQITLGGLSVKEINGDFSSKECNDLFVIGEVLDVDGASGGYNLSFAWLGGYVAGKAISKLI